MSEPSESVVIEGGLRVRVPARLDRMTSYVLREQRGWFEAELAFVRALLLPGMRVVDVGANHGVYTLTAARCVGPAGKVWAFEPARRVAELLRQSLDENEFFWVDLQPSALSNQAGQATLHTPDDTELASLSSSVAGQGDPVETRTLDEAAAALGLTGVDLLKLDAEGEELRILEASGRFFEQNSPLVLFERMHGAQVNEALLARLVELGFGLYRLIPGLTCLAPFDRSDEADAFQLNLFACAAPRAQQLAARGLLALAGATPLPALDPGYFWQQLDAFPYARKLAPRWAPRAPTCEPLSQRAAAHQGALPAATRVALLTACRQALSALAADGPTPGRLLSLARASAELGERAYAVAVLGDAIELLKQGKPLDPTEPFLLPCPRFDRLTPRGATEGFCLAAAVEQRERLRTHSTFFTGNVGRDDLLLLQKLGYLGEDMERRLQLMDRVFGPRRPG